MIFVIIVLSVFLGDLLLKKYVEDRLSEKETRYILGGGSASGNSATRALPWAGFPITRC